MQGGEWQVNFEFDNNTPIYIQLVEQLKTKIISSQISPGERLPSIRELALKTRVNPNTMQKALGELEQLKLIYTDRTNGKFVTEDKNLISKFKDESANAFALKYFNDMQKLGLNQKEAIEYLKKLKGEE